MNKQRSSNFELMRVFSMLAILAFHYQIHIDSDTMMYQAFSNNQLIAIILGSWGTLGTNLFFILSFYFWITSAKTEEEYKQKQFNKIVKLIIKVAVFGVLLYLLAAFTGYIEIEYLYLIKCVFGAFTYMYWFFTAYIILALLHPYLNKFLNLISKKELRTLLFILFPVVYILPIVIGYFDLTGRLGCAIYIYLFIGYLERKIEGCGKNSHIFEKHAVKGFILTSLIVIVYEISISLIGTYFYPQIQNYIEIFEGTQSPLLFVDSVFAFYIFKNIRLKSNSLINFLGAHSQGAFLIHGPGKLSRLILWDAILRGNVYYHSSSRKFIVHYIICVSGLFILGVIAHFLYTVLFEKIIDNYLQNGKWKNKQFL